ncbi:MAG: hypothetical protein NTU79_11790 [Planctomycetota bacterium]|nr:hypothetical protein [Planctomycetota bacterium]
MNSSIRKLFSVTSVFLSFGIGNYSLAQTENKDPAFRPRSDSGAIRDTQALREQLNKMKDSRGPINPLGDFLQRNSQQLQNERGRDTESEQKPSLRNSPDDFRSSDSTPDPKRSKGIVLLPGPKFTIIQQASPSQASYAALDTFRPARFVSDLEATSRPTLQAPVAFASADVPVIGKTIPVAAYYQLGPVLPGGNGGPPPRPSVPNAVPQATAAPTFAPAPTTFAPPPTMFVPPPTMFVPPPATFVAPPTTFVQPPTTFVQPPMTFVPPPTTFVQPPTTFVPPPATFVAPPTTYVPQSFPQPSIPQGFSQVNPPPITSMPIGGMGPSGGVPTNPGTTFVAPPPYYPTNPTNLATGGAPMRSSSDIMPRSQPRSNTINGPPFVSPPPCQFDADFMVSSNVHRQSLDPCANTSSADDMRSGASPFSYVPPTSMPATVRKSYHHPIIGFGQTLDNTYASRGIVGQPKLYKDGQPVRNFVRYLTP